MGGAREHHDKAEELLEMARYARSPQDRDAFQQAAQVEATLALQAQLAENAAKGSR